MPHRSEQDLRLSTAGSRSRCRLVGALGVVAVLSIAAGCTDRGVLSPDAALPEAHGGPLLTTYDSSTRQLGVSVVSNVNKFGTEGGYTVHSSVTGGSGPYMYVWYLSRSWDEGGDFQFYDSGWGKDSIQFYVYPDDMKIVVMLSVGDSQVPVWAGDAERTFLGPAAVHAGDGGTPPCENYDPGVRFDDGVDHDLDHTGKWYLDVCTRTHIYDAK